MRILLDMDCVITDFIEGYARLWGLTTADLVRHWPAGEYGMNGPVGRALLNTGRYQPVRWCEKTKEALPFDDTGFWKKVEACPGFWSDLPELPWCRELLDLVQATTDDWYVVTSPSRCPRCIPEKRAWLHRVLGVPAGGWYDRMIPTPHKELMASHFRDGAYKSAVLIDDYDRNCDAFDAAGGNAILFPGHHNRLHALKADPMSHVRKELTRLKGA